MKKVLLSALTVMALSQAATAADTIEGALKEGTYSTNMRVFYFNRGFDGVKPRARALTAGGIMKYVSGDLQGFKAGFAYYGSHRLFGIYTREEGKGTSILGRDGQDLAFLGEAYIQYDNENTMFKIGRQQLSTPLMNNHDLRILPAVYEAAILRNKDIQNTMVEVGYVQRYTGFCSKDNKFNDYNTKWGKDGLGYIYVKNTGVQDLTIRAQYIKALSDEDDAGNTIPYDDYKYFDIKYKLAALGQNTYIKAQYGGNAYNVGDDSTMYGIKGGTTFGMFDVALLYNKIEDNIFKAVEAGPMYSDWQQGYGNYEPSEAFGGQIIAHPIAGLSVKLGYVDVSADDGYVTDDFSETNVDIKYKLTSNSKVRVRYSIKDQTEESGKEDRDDFRVIYYLNF